MQITACVKNFVILSICILLCGCKSEVSNYFFWELSKGTQKIYLLGVMHELPKKYAVVPAHVRKAYDESSVIFVESVRYDTSSKTSKQNSVEKNAFDKIEQEFIDSQIKRLVNDKLISVSEGDKIANSSIALLNRTFAPIIETRIEKLPKFDYLKHTGNSLGLDNILGQQALLDKKKLRGLEAADSYFKAWLDNCNTSKNYIRALEGMMHATYDDDYIIDVNSQNRELFVGDLTAYVKTTNRLIEKYAYLKLENECATVPRTFEWAKRWETIFKNTSAALVIVGANHVSIEPSLKTLLEKQGYVARRITE